MTYFIGIDFGHAETCASRAPGYNGARVSRIPLRRADRVEDQKVISAVCQSGNGWQLVFSEKDYKSPSLREGFKAPIDILTDNDRDALREFGRLIFSEIRDRIREEAGNDDFEIEICIANPSGWRRDNPNAPGEYLRFFRDKCGIPVTLCINESDAALYSRLLHNDNVAVDDTVLIIDLGSSTIDFTAYQNSILKECWGVPVGAHRIEDRIVGRVIATNHDDVKNAEELRKQMGINGNLIAALSLYAREEKEEYYTNTNRRNYEIIIPMANLVPLPNDDNRRLQNVVNFQLNMEDFDRDIAGEYESSLKEELDSARIKLRRLNVTPNRIILSGGASRMNFVADCVKNAFPNATINIDQAPAWVVSDGTAQFIKTFEECVAAIESWANDRNLLRFAADRALKECMEEYLTSRYLNRESDTSVRAFIDIFERMKSKPEFLKSVELKFAEGIGKIISRHFRIKINNPCPLINWEKFVSIRDDFPDEIKQIATDLFVWGGGSLNMEKDREEEYQRKDLIDGTVSRVLREHNPENDYIPTKQKIRNYLRDILNKNGMSISMIQD